jgi:hypothetical protein
MYFFIVSIYLLYMKQKTLLISETTHDTLKKYCKENSIKINDWVEKLILEQLKKRVSDGK